MYNRIHKRIYKKIKQYNKIVIARHVGADPDALGSSIGLKDIIKNTFPNKEVYVVGTPANKFKYIGDLDQFNEDMYIDSLLIVTDTPDKKRVDFSFTTSIDYSIKIDHHPFVEKFCDLEYIDDTASSASEIVLELINETPLVNSFDIANTTFNGIASDTNRFMFNASSKVLGLCSRLLEEYKIDTQLVYSNLYTRPLTEVRLQGYIGLNMKVTENGFGYIKLFDDVLNNLSVDSGSAGNMVNTFNYIEGVYAWAVVTKDSKNDLFKVNIRSRGPVINSVAEKYNGGGHKFASGARIHDEEQVDLLLKDLDLACLKYIEEEVAKNED